MNKDLIRIKLTLKDHILMVNSNNETHATQFIQTRYPFFTNQDFIETIPSNFIDIEYISNNHIKEEQNKIKLLPQDDDCNANEIIPGNIHSQKTMLCDMCDKTTNKAGSVRIDGYSICMCCDNKINNILLQTQEIDIPNRFFQITNSISNKKLIFDNFAWKINEIKNEINKKNK